MKDSELVPIVVFSTLVGILIILFIVWKYCYQNGRFIWPCKEEELRLLPSSSKSRTRVLSVLVKRCDQSSTYEIENRIIDRLKRQSSVKIHEKSWERGLDDGQQPVIVFCVYSSRIGADIENAMRGVHGSSHVVLVLLHCVLSGLLRGDLSDEEELLDSSLKNRMTGIAHFAFSSGEELYDSPQNEVGFGKLANLVKSLPS